MKIVISNKRLSFIISIIYVGLGTLYGLAYWTYLNPSNAFSDFLFYFFMPASFLLEVILFTERDPFFLVLFTQIFTFFIFWAIFNFILGLFSAKK